MFAYSVEVPYNAVLASLTGDISASPITTGTSPQGYWSVTSSFYVTPSCSPGKSIITFVPTDSILVYSVLQSGIGGIDLQQTVDLQLDYGSQPLSLQTGECIVAVTSMEGLGAVDYENQVEYILINP
jgi:hypothetical protein